jgi:hypothetical protein
MLSWIDVPLQMDVTQIILLFAEASSRGRATDRRGNRCLCLFNIDDSRWQWIFLSCTLKKPTNGARVPARVDARTLFGSASIVVQEATGSADSGETDGRPREGVNAGSQGIAHV